MFRIPTARATAKAVERALDAGRTDDADRLVTELFSRVRHDHGLVPAQVLEQPDSTGDVRYDTLLAVGLAFVLAVRGEEPREWMRDVRPLAREWLWDGDAQSSPQFRA